MSETLLRQDTMSTPHYRSLGDGLEAAEAARNRGDDVAALAIFAQLREQFPEHSAPYLRAVSSLSQLRRFDEAEQLLAEGANRFPDDPGFAIERGWLAYRRGDFTTAIERWREIRHPIPEHHIGHTAGALALRDAGCLAEAEALLVEAISRFPLERGPLTEHAWLAASRRDWPEAVRRRRPRSPEAHVVPAFRRRQGPAAISLIDQ